MAKFTIVAYFFWLCLGWLGIHHFYLGRDCQGLLWLTSFAGCFGIGWLRDFYRIPTYVKDANEDQHYLEYITAQMRYDGSPRVLKNIHRVLGQLMFASFYRSLIFLAIPEEYSDLTPLLVAVLPLGTVFGTYMVSNVGRIKSSLRYAIIGAYLGEFLFGSSHLCLEDQNVPLAIGTAMVLSTYGWEYDRRPQAVRVKKCSRRVAVWMLVILVFSSLCCSFLYFNASVTSQDGEKIKLREAVGNFFRSPHWAKMKQSFWDLYEQYQHEGWEGVKRRFAIISDLEGEERSLEIFNISRNATFHEIKERYKVLAKQWHPDHNTDKEYAQTRFMEIQEAYDTLKKIRKRRDKRTNDEL